MPINDEEISFVADPYRAGPRFDSEATGGYRGCCHDCLNGFHSDLDQFLNLIGNIQEIVDPVCAGNYSDSFPVSPGCHLMPRIQGRLNSLPELRGSFYIKRNFVDKPDQSDGGHQTCSAILHQVKRCITQKTSVLNCSHTGP